MRFFLQSKSFRVLLVVCFLQLLVCDDKLFASTNQTIVTNVHYKQRDEQIIITYDLSGDFNKQYEVTISLQKKSDPSFSYVPKEVTGEVGNNIECGENLSAEWNVTEEFSEGLQGEDYYFVVHATEENEASISPWVWIGAALIVGGVVYFLVNKSKEETPNEFPNPPGRPN